jgi:Domain of unknown function (DUF1931)
MTKGLRASIREFKQVDEKIELTPILDHITARPPLGLRCGEDTEASLPAIAGGFSIALARTFKIIDPELKNPRTEHWQRAFSIFDLLQSSDADLPPRSSIQAGLNSSKKIDGRHGRSGRHV